MSLSSLLAPGLQFDRFSWVPGLEVHVCTAPSPGRRLKAMTNELELVVQLGDAAHVRTRRGLQHVGDRRLGVLNPGDSYDITYPAGTTVFFSVAPTLLGVTPEGRDVVAELSWPVQARLVDLTRALLDARREGAPVEREQAEHLLGELAPQLSLKARDGLAATREYIAQHFDREPLLSELAEVAKLHPVVLLRRFKARYGTTPVQHRIKTQLNEAARLGWQTPARPLREIARCCGFVSPSYFHRSFRRYLGTTPARHRRA